MQANNKNSLPSTRSSSSSQEIDGNQSDQEGASTSGLGARLRVLSNQTHYL